VRDVLLDTDVIIEFLRGRSIIRERLRALLEQEIRLVYTPISIAEIHAGLRAGEEGSIEAFFSALDAIPLDNEIGEKAGEYLRKYAKGHGVELADAFIAAVASLRDLCLWTLNRKHYPMPDIELMK